MNEFVTDEERVEQIKKWWKDNGTALIIGVVLGLSLLFGWRTWSSHQERQAEIAGMKVSQLQMQIQGNDLEAATANFEDIKAEFAGTTYGVLAAYEMAAHHINKQEFEQAAAVLGWALQQADGSELEAVTRMRLARVQMQLEQYDAALATLPTAKQPKMTALIDDLRGDIYREKGERAKAHAAYQAALDSLPSDHSYRGVVEFKRNDTADAVEGGAE